MLFREILIVKLSVTEVCKREIVAEIGNENDEADNQAKNKNKNKAPRIRTHHVKNDYKLNNFNDSKTF